METAFTFFSFQHITILVVFGILSAGLIVGGKQLPAKGQYAVALVLASITFLALVLEAIVLVDAQDYDVRTDLPVYLCDIITVMLPVVVYHRNRKWIGILYFWALAGTLQALLTPDIDHGFPSFHFFRYFIMHCGIVLTILFVVIVWKIRIRWRDWFNAVLFAQLYLLVIHVYNQVMDTNYSYTIKKPDGTTVLDLFGEWPWYILGGELMMVFLFTLLMLPFAFKQRLTVEEKEREMENNTAG